jgi:hypothetical protein
MLGLILKKTMRLFQAENSAHLIKQISKVDSKVPKRTQGRKTKHTEIWTILRFISTYANMKLFCYPLEIIHRDKPDFLLNTSSSKIGIEITESIPEDYAYTFALAEKYFPQATVEPSMFLRGTPKRSKKEILEILEKSQNRSTGLGIYGDKIEMDWADWIIDDIVSKTKKLNESKFEKFDSNILLIYDNLPHAANNINVQINYLEPKTNNYFDNKTYEQYIFDQIFIICGQSIIEINKERQLIKPINDIWKH